MHTGAVYTTRSACRKPKRQRVLLEKFDRRVEDVTGAALSLDVLRLGRIGFYLAPQPENLHVDRAIVHFSTVQSRQIEQLVATEHALRRRAESLQQTEFTVREVDALAFGG